MKVLLDFGGAVAHPSLEFTTAYRVLEFQDNLHGLLILSIKRRVSCRETSKNVAAIFVVLFWLFISLVLLRRVLLYEWLKDCFFQWEEDRQMHGTVNLATSSHLKLAREIANRQSLNST